MPDELNLLVYSDDASVRQAVIEGVGLRAAKGLPTINWLQAATPPAVLRLVEEVQPEVVILDAETPKNGGMSVARQIQAELDYQPNFVFLVARPQDEWLASWAKGSATVQAPYDPIDLQEKIAAVLAREL